MKQEVVEINVEVVKELKARGHILVRADGSVELEAPKVRVSEEKLARLGVMLGRCGLGPMFKWDSGGRCFVKVGKSAGIWRECKSDDLVEFVLSEAERFAPDVRVRWKIMEQL